MAESDGEDGPQATPPRSPNKYYWGQVVPRLRKILGHWTFVLTIMASICLYLCAHWTSFGDVSIASLRSNLTAYAALSFGASIGGCVLILTLPNRDFIRTISLHKLEGSCHSSYSDLLFVFTFSAMAQLATIGVVVAMYGLGGSEQVLADHTSLSHHVLLILAAVVVVFSVLRLVLVVTTLSQLGVVIENDANCNDIKDADASEFITGDD